MAEVLLVDAAFSALPLYHGLRAMGHRVHTVGSRPGDALARINPNHGLLDYSDTEALAAYVDRHAIEFLVPGCTDMSYASCAALSGAGRFPGIERADTIEKLHDKRLFRSIAREYGLSVPEVYEEASSALNLPVIVKPVDVFSGQGISVANNPGELAAACKRARTASRSGRIVVERFVSGQLCSHSAFIVDQRIASDFFVEEHCVAEPWKVDLSHVHSVISEPMRTQLRAEIEALSAGMGLTDGLLHMQFIHDGKQFWWIEPTRRCPGDLYSQLIELSFGPGYVERYLAAFVGIKPGSAVTSEPRFIVRHTVNCPAGTVFEGLEWQPSVPVRKVVPLMQPGESAGARSRRSALVFYEYESLTSLQDAVHRHGIA